MAKHCDNCGELFTGSFGFDQHLPCERTRVILPSPFTVYLCGGINGLSDADCKDWRAQATTGLLGAATLDPMRRDFRGIEGEHTQEIVEGDLEDIRRSDLVLANCARPSWGTAMEIRFAREIGVPVIGFNVERKGASPWLRYHLLYMMPELERAIDQINAADFRVRVLAVADRHR